MTWFMVRFEGDGLKAQVDNDIPILWGLFKIKRKAIIAGFYTTRYVEAEDAESAIVMARESTMRELANVVPLSVESWRNLVLKIDDICTVDPRDADPNAKGFNFF